VLHHQRVAVGRGVGEQRGGDRPAGAAAVLDQEGLLQVARHLLGEQAGDDIDRAAGGERREQRDRLFGVARGGRLGSGCAGHQQARRPQQRSSRQHPGLLQPSKR
jgi:hypothetical protein